MSAEVSMKTLTCRTCGADLIFDPETQATVCNYCGNKFHVEEVVDKVIPPPDWILPFKVKKEEYLQKLLEWLVQGDYTPDDILESSVFDQVNGIYLPLFMYVGKYSATWVASAGYDRKEEYLEKNFEGKLVTKTRTVTDWRPCNGEANGSFTESIFAGERIKPEIAQFMADCKFSSGDLKDYDPMYTLGFVMQEFAGSEQAIWESQIASRVTELVEAAIWAKIPGDRQRDMSYDHSTDTMVYRTYAPCWLVYYKYNGEEYHVCMDGVTATRIDGIRPVDQDRKKAVSKLFFPAHISLVVCIVVLLPIFAALSGRLEISDDYDWIGITLSILPAIILYIRAAIKRADLVEASNKIRQERLEECKARGASLIN